MDAEQLARYADAIVNDALLIGAGERLAVHGEPAHRDLVVALAEAGYRAGAERVDALLLDPRVTRARALGAPLETLDRQLPWEEARMREILRRGDGIVWINGPEDPDLMADVPSARASQSGLQRPGYRPYLRAFSRGIARFCVVAYATPAWARKVYPEVDDAAAVAALERDLISFARIGPDDPPGGWGRHCERLEGIADALTERGLRTLHLRGPGTDLQLALPEGTVWHGGRLSIAGGDRRFSPNVPTEEVFTSPAPRATSGTFRCTRPLQVMGRVIDGIACEFRGGRLVRVEADRDDDRDFLAAYWATDPGAGMLGEVALVDGRSRVGSTGRQYWTTLLDENAVSHVALGQGFAIARAPGAPRPNRSRVHEDVMIGGPDLEVRGSDAAGAPVAVLVGGEFGLS